MVLLFSSFFFVFCRDSGHTRHSCSEDSGIREGTKENEFLTVGKWKVPEGQRKRNLPFQRKKERRKKKRKEKRIERRRKKRRKEKKEGKEEREKEKEKIKKHSFSTFPHNLFI